MFGLQDGAHLQAAFPAEASTEPPLPPGVGHHPEDLCLHQPHGAPGSPGALARGAGGEAASSTFANHLRDESKAFRCKSL